MGTKGKGRQAIMVAAIDFGTTFSGYAFSFRHDFEHDPLKVQSSNWTTGSRVAISLKTSSCVLFDPKAQFNAFGFEAEDKYSDLALDGDHEKWYYFRRFKMLLYGTGSAHRTSVLLDETGKEMPAMLVFSAAIGYLKDHMLRCCNDMCQGIRPEDIKWVLTVPAIWDDGAKQFMREAAVKSGIRDDMLCLALEPEAASMFCKYLPVERITGSSKEKITCFQPKSKYLVLDAGGGTVDITLHEVQSNGTLHELYKANGGAWGGTTIDKKFFEFIKSIVGPEVIDKFRKEYKDDYMDLHREFEVKKRTVQPDLDSKITFKIPISLHELYREMNNGEIRDAVRETPELAGRLTFAGDKMRVEPEVVKRLFAETNEHIVNHLFDIFNKPEARGTNTILMVGGFSESPMLRDAVQKAFSDKRVIIPHEAGLAVLKGAVIFGHNDNVITSRICKFTYGFKVRSDFIQGVHPECKKHQRRDGTYALRGIFEKIVEIGQPVSPGEPFGPSKGYFPTEGCTGFTIKLFASPEKEPQYVDDPGCVSVGEVSVDSRDRRGQIAAVKVALIFGGTELEVLATHSTTGEKTKASFDFLE